MKNQVEALLFDWIEPETGQKLINQKSLKHLIIKENAIEIEITLGFPLGDHAGRISQEIKQQLAPLTRDVQVSVLSKIEPHVNGAHVSALKGVKNIIAVGSGKGGVGKSTVSFHLARGMAALGARVGLLDADIYGPSQPSMFGLQGTKPEVQDGKFVPLMRHHLQTMSIGYLIGADVPMIWRGPMIGKALQQMLADTAWNRLDYLIVDLPPGTGDIQLTLCQKMPVTGALMVTTPQELALLDVRRAAEMLKKMNVPILGFVENMSGHRCDACGHTEAIFGEGGGEKIASLFEAPLFTHIPLDRHVREETDAGHCFTGSASFQYTTLFSMLALKIAERIARMPKDFSSVFPPIKVEG